VTRPGAALVIQLAVSLALLAMLARQVPLRDAAGALARLRPGTLVTCVALALVGYWGRARRWSLLLARCGVPMSTVTSYGLTLVGTFYGLVTPGRVGELARVLHVRAPRTATLAAAIWDRVADVLLLELLCIPAFVFVPAWRGALLGLYLVLVAATVTGAALLASPAAAAFAARLVPPLGPRLARWSGHSRELLHGGVSASSLLWGTFFYVFMYAVAWLLLRDIAPQASPLLMLGLPVIPLLGNLPVALGGLGLREQVSAAVFGQFGAGAVNGAVFSLMLFAVMTLLPGLLGFAATRLSGLRRPHADGSKP
jgi:uncharacterized membrane protein YbhN (UPF0104 family)